MIKFGESFSLSSLLNQSQTYQGNPCGVYPDISSFIGSGVIQNSVACIEWSAPTQVHIIWYQSFGSWYRFYPILLFFSFFGNLSMFRSCLRLVAFLFVSLFRSCSCLFLSRFFCSCSCFLCLVSFRLCVKKKEFVWVLVSCFLFLCLSYYILSSVHNFCFSLFEFCLG